MVTKNEKIIEIKEAHCVYKSTNIFKASNFIFKL